MLTNYLKVALRSLWRHVSFALINLIGLSVGLACCLSIYLFVQDELMYDRFQAKADRIYRVINQRTSEGKQSRMAVTPPAYGQTLKANFPEALLTVSFQSIKAAVVSPVKSLKME